MAGSMITFTIFANLSSVIFTLHQGPHNRRMILRPNGPTAIGNFFRLDLIRILRQRFFMQLIAYPRNNTRMDHNTDDDTKK